MSLLLLLKTQGGGTPPTPQAVAGDLSLSGSLTFNLRTPRAVAGTLSMSGALVTALRTTKALTGDLGLSGDLATSYNPPPAVDGMTTLRRRNQTD